MTNTKLLTLADVDNSTNQANMMGRLLTHQHDAKKLELATQKQQDATTLGAAKELLGNLDTPTTTRDGAITSLSKLAGVAAPTEADLNSGRNLIKQYNDKPDDKEIGTRLLQWMSGRMPAKDFMEFQVKFTDAQAMAERNNMTRSEAMGIMGNPALSKQWAENEMTTDEDKAKTEVLKAQALHFGKQGQLADARISSISMTTKKIANEVKVEEAYGKETAKAGLGLIKERLATLQAKRVQTADDRAAIGQLTAQVSKIEEAAGQASGWTPEARQERLDDLEYQRESLVTERDTMVKITPKDYEGDPAAFSNLRADLALNSSNMDAVKAQQAYIRNPTPETMAAMKTAGDRLNRQIAILTEDKKNAQEGEEGVKMNLVRANTRRALAGANETRAKTARESADRDVMEEFASYSPKQQTSALAAQLSAAHFKKTGIRPSVENIMKGAKKEGGIKVSIGPSQKNRTDSYEELREGDSTINMISMVEDLVKRDPTIVGASGDVNTIVSGLYQQSQQFKTFFDDSKKQLVTEMNSKGFMDPELRKLMATTIHDNTAQNQYNSLKFILIYKHARAMNGPGVLSTPDFNASKESLGLGSRLTGAKQLMDALSVLKRITKQRMDGAKKMLGEEDSGGGGFDMGAFKEALEGAATP